MNFTELSCQDILDFAIPTKEYAEVMKWWPRPNIDWSDRSTALAQLRTITSTAKAFDKPDPMVAEEHYSVPMRDGHISDLWVFRPNGDTADGLSPLIVLLHGGGLVMGGPIECAGIARAAVKRFGAVVAVPAYRLAPENAYPMQIHDCWDSFLWIAQHAQSTLRADPLEGFVVGGESAGGTLAIILTRFARDQKVQPGITGLWLSAVFVPFRENGSLLLPKYRERNLSITQPECLDNPVYSHELAEFLKDSLEIGETMELSDPDLWTGEGAFESFPRTYFQICGRDARRDEGLIYRDMLQNAGVQTKLTLYKGLPHCFWYSLKDIPEYTQRQKDSISGLAWLLDT